MAKARATGTAILVPKPPFRLHQLIRRETKALFASDRKDRPNQLARALTLGETRTLGFVVLDLSHLFFGDHSGRFRRRESA